MAVKLNLLNQISTKTPLFFNFSLTHSSFLATT